MQETELYDAQEVLFNVGKLTKMTEIDDTRGTV
jgi:hypothetical protein